MSLTGNSGQSSRLTLRLADQHTKHEASPVISSVTRERPPETQRGYGCTRERAADAVFYAWARFDRENVLSFHVREFLMFLTACLKQRYIH